MDLWNWSVLISIVHTYNIKGEKIYVYFPFYRRFAILYVEYIIEEVIVWTRRYQITINILNT